MDSPCIHEWVFAQADRRPDAPAIGTPVMWLSYAALAERVRTFAAQLSVAGVVAGDRVLVAVPNSPAAVVAGLAVHALGATLVEASREWGPEMLARIVGQARARQAVVWGRDARTWAKVCARTPLEKVWVVHPGPLSQAILDVLGASPSLLLEDGRVDPALAPAPFVPASVARGAPALVLFTSGSTRRPRGVVQTFGNIDANTRSIVRYLELSCDDRALLVLPLYYCYGRSVLQTHLFVGGSVFLENRFAFPRVALETLGAEGCTGFAGVPLTFEILKRQVDVATLAFPRLRYVTQAGGAMAQETIDWVRTSFSPAKLFVMYGQTEATARLAYLPPERAEDKRGSFGIPIPGVELRVVDSGGHELAAGEVGHLVARGANVTPGYLDEPAETAEILRDGWLWTGDLARRDADGFFFHEGRSKEILKVGGYRVSPVEIEHVVASHPGLADAAVVGKRDALMGELPVAFVVPRGGTLPDHSELSRYCRERLAAYKVPVRFVTVHALPRNGAGKLLRAELALRANGE